MKLNGQRQKLNNSYHELRKQPYGKDCCQFQNSFKENSNQQDKNTYSNSSIFNEIQDIERQYQLKIEQLNKVNTKLMQTIEYLQKSLDESKIMLQNKQCQINKQQFEIHQLKQLIQDHTHLNLRNIRTEIEDEKIKTERLKQELDDFKYKFIKEQPLVQLFKRFEKTQEEQSHQNKQFLNQVMQILDKPRSQSSHRQSRKSVF